MLSYVYSMSPVCCSQLWCSICCCLHCSSANRPLGSLNRCLTSWSDIVWGLNSMRSQGKPHHRLPEVRGSSLTGKFISYLLLFISHCVCFFSLNPQHVRYRWLKSVIFKMKILEKIWTCQRCWCSIGEPKKAQERKVFLTCHWRGNVLAADWMNDLHSVKSLQG